MIATPLSAIAATANIAALSAGPTPAADIRGNEMNAANPTITTVTMVGQSPAARPRHPSHPTASTGPTAAAARITIGGAAHTSISRPAATPAAATNANWWVEVAGGNGGQPRIT